MKEFPGAYPCTAHDCTSPEAIGEMIKAEDFPQAVKGIIGVTAWMNRGKIVVSIKELETWIHALPKEMARSPEIMFTRAWILAGQGHCSKAAVLMEEVFALWHERWKTEQSDVTRQWLF